MAETATGVLVVTAIATSGHDDFAAENEIPIGPAVALSVHYCTPKSMKNIGKKKRLVGTKFVVEIWQCYV